MATVQEKAIAARVLKDVAGLEVNTIAEMLGADRSTVYRWLDRVAAEDKPQTTVLERLEGLLEGVELDKVGELRAELARSLADTIDRCRISKVAQDHASVPAIAKEFRDVLAEILEVSEDDKEWVRGLFGQ